MNQTSQVLSSCGGIGRPEVVSQLCPGYFKGTGLMFWLGRGMVLLLVMSPISSKGIGWNCGISIWADRKRLEDEQAASFPPDISGLHPPLAVLGIASVEG